MTDKSYAVNLCDLMAYGGVLSPVLLILHPILTEEVRDCELHRIDGAALLVDPEVDEDRWSAIFEIFRKGAGRLEPIPKYKLRIYESKTGRGSWKRI